MDEDSNSVSPSDWISAVCAVIATVIALVTVVTVYVAARQLLNEHRAYQLGLSFDSLGPWRSKVKTKKHMGLQQEIASPFLSIPALVKQKWEPNLAFPVGFSGLGDSPQVDSEKEVDAEKALAGASWVNFMQALGISPHDTALYRMRGQSALVNGIIPMRWTGRDLVSIAAILGFKSSEKEPSDESPMPLPVHWHGPQGWLQFRESPEGCVVEFRRRAITNNGLTSTHHDYYSGEQDREPQPHILHSRLWVSIGAMPLKSGKAIYLGLNFGCQHCERRKEYDSARRTHRKTKRLCDVGSCSCGKAEALPGYRSPDSKNDVSPDALFDELMNSEDPPEEAMRIVQDPLPWIEKKINEDPKGREWTVRARTMEVLMPASGGISSIIESELASARGLDIRNCLEYGRQYIYYDNIDHAKFPYHLGQLFMDREVLHILKEGLGLMKPDGYYFVKSHNPVLADDLEAIYLIVDSVVYDPLSKSKLFQDLDLDAWPTVYKHREELHHAMLLCNELQGHRKGTIKAQLTIGDMEVISRASYSLRKTLETAHDLSWAMLICRELFEDLADLFEDMRDLDVLNCTVSCRGEVLDCTRLLGPNETDDPESAGTPRTYDVPLCADGDFSGAQMLAAFMVVIITNAWIGRACTRASNVGVYDHTIPQTLIMC